MTIKVESLPPVRRHTFHFLEKAKESHAIYLSTEIDATAIMARKATFKQASMNISYVSFFLYTISRAIEAYPEVNCSVQGRQYPKRWQFSSIDGKITFDTRAKGERIVTSSVLQALNQKSLTAIQDEINQIKSASFEKGEQFKSIRRLQQLPTWLGRMIYNKIMKNPETWQQTQGSFTVTSLGHVPINSFFPMTSNTTCFGIGAIRRCPVVMEDDIVIRPMLTLSMSFDHRAIDGALAADFLHHIKHMIEDLGEETWPEDQKIQATT
ncbi:2-oxo acid dehydrogenase subunit E2 [Halalkalibacter alkalisediminis]|uniref:2-oxo acid dehydrogenase subunit E2 n=1 Tax=Halalkalibacter alkalisediminis TaxID=935616 RepID=A0ABV6NP43_9BACI|nr:2-oxo acid dehydrogenase subunit E2 [Halalkalibacter alkalisediminis]